MGSVIEYLGHIVLNGRSVRDECPSSFERAENMVGRHLDRRRSYAIFGDELREVATWSRACLECYEGGYDKLTSCGPGCEYCGFTGRRRKTVWLPSMADAASRKSILRQWQEI